MGLLDNIFGERGSEERLRMKMGLMGLTHQPNQQLMQMWGGELQNMQDERKATAQANKTAQYLRSLGTPQAMQAADALENGMVDASTAYQMATKVEQAPDPREYMREVNGQLVYVGPDLSVQTLYGQPPAPDPQSAIAKLQADLQAGLINQEQYDLAVANMAPPGMSIESDGQGGFRMVQGPGVNGAARPFTEAQSKDNVYATRAKGALEVLNPIADALVSRGEQIAESVPLGFGREFQTQAFQVAKQAGDEFLQAILRKDTGAAITAQEQALYGETFLPRPGDGPAVLEAKKAARQRAIAAIEAGMSAAQIVATEQALVQTAKRTGAPAQATMSDDDLLRKYGLQP